MRLFYLVLLLVTLLFSILNAQVYIGDSVVEWSGACDNSCPQTSPCQLPGSATASITTSCVLYFESEYRMPGSALYMGVGGNITLTSLGPGPVYLSDDWTVESIGGGIVLQNFTSHGPHSFRFTSSAVYIFDSSVTFTDASQISLGGGPSSFGGVCSLVVIQNSNFTTTAAAPLMSWDLARGAKVHLSGVNADLVQGLARVDVADSVPSVHIRDSNITGLMFNGHPLGHISLENVNGMLLSSASVFDASPGVITISDSILSSTSNSFLTSGSGYSNALVISRSHFENVVVRGPASEVYLENSTFTLNDLYDPVITVWALERVVMRNISINTLTDFGPAPALIILSIPTQLYLKFSDLVYSSPSSVPRMSFGSAAIYLEEDVVFPSLDVLGGVYFYGNFTPEFSGNLTTSTNGPSPITFVDSPKVILHSISIGDDVSFRYESGARPEFAYRVTDPSHGIQCANQAACVSQPPGIATSIIWDSSLPLPIASEPYPYINTSSTAITFASDSSEYTISSSSSDSVSFFTFNEVACPSFCNPAYSGACVSTAQCTCNPGHEGDCTYPPTVPVTPTGSAPHQAAGWCILLGLLSLVLF